MNGCFNLSFRKISNGYLIRLKYIPLGHLLQISKQPVVTGAYIWSINVIVAIDKYSLFEVVNVNYTLNIPKN